MAVLTRTYTQETTIQMLTITIQRTSTLKYRALMADGEVLCTSKTPLLDAARVLKARGYTGQLGMTRDGIRIDMSGDIERLANRVVIENEKVGPRFGKYRALVHDFDE